MEQQRKEFWVGTLVLFSVGLLLVFAWLLGFVQPLGKRIHLSVFYQFAGGVEVGAPVRVSGVKVGKVEKIEFLSSPASENVAGTSVKVLIGLDSQVRNLIRQNSKFYINIAGIIGERYLEVTPGSEDSPVLENGSEVRGMDPPRVDQLLSQGYGVFGRVQEFLERNENTMQELLTSVHSLMTDTNSILKKLDRKKVSQLIENLNTVSANVAVLSQQLRSPKSSKFIDQLADLVDRAHEIDKPALQKFLQEEGVRARIF
ncbi:MAG: MCE family protein [Proteobacteria bacterium]|nr:MCE family protein [Pseudomonadota bacterium]